jgi:hypothetical protein
MPNLALPHPLLQQRVRRIEPPGKKKSEQSYLNLSFTETVSITSVVEKEFQNYIPEPLLKS